MDRLQRNTAAVACVSMSLLYMPLPSKAGVSVALDNVYS